MRSRDGDENTRAEARPWNVALLKIIILRSALVMIGAFGQQSGGGALMS